MISLTSRMGLGPGGGGVGDRWEPAARRSPANLPCPSRHNALPSSVHLSGPGEIRLYDLVKYQALYLLGASEITANLCCNYVYLYWEGCVIFSIYLR